MLGVVGGPNRPGAGSWPGTRGMADRPNATSVIYSGLYDERLQQNANLSHIHLPYLHMYILTHLLACIYQKALRIIHTYQLGWKRYPTAPDFYKRHRYVKGKPNPACNNKP